MDFVDNFQIKYNLLKKLALTEVYILDSDYQVTLLYALFGQVFLQEIV